MKISVNNYERWLKCASKELVLIALAKLMRERHVANRMISLARKRIEELEKEISYENIVGNLD